MNLYSVVALCIFGFFMLLGLLFGLMRGTKKALIRFITLAAAFGLAIMLTPVISNLVAKMLLDRFMGSADLGEQGTTKSVQDIINAKNSPFLKMSLSAFNPLVFIAVFLVFWFISLIVYAILKGVFRGKGGDFNIPMRKLIGMVVGLGCGFIMFLWLFVPINGYLRVAGKVGTIENKKGVSILADLDDESVGGLSVSINDYYDSGISNSLGLGLDRFFFDALTTTKVKGTSIHLTKEVDTVVKLYNQYSAIDLKPKEILTDSKALDDMEEIVSTLFESKLVIVSVDFMVDYLIENPSFLKEFTDGDSESKSSANPLLSTLLNAYPAMQKNIITAETEGEKEAKSDDYSLDFINDEELLLTVLNNLKGNNIKKTILSCFDVLRVAQKNDINLTDFNADSFTKMDDTAITELVGAIIDVPIVRDLLPFMMGMVYEPIANTLNMEIDSKRPVVTNWENEKTQLIIIFKGINSLSSLANLSGGEMDDIQEFFGNDNNQVVLIGRLLDAFRSSQLMGDLYDALTKFDTEKEEYFIVNYLNEVIFSAAGDTTGDTSSKTLRSLFNQQDAQKTNPTSPKDTIDFKKLNWTTLFGNISDMISFIISIKDLENMDLSTADPKDIVDILKKLDEFDNKSMINDVLEAFIPEDSRIVIPDLENIDFKSEAEIVEKLFEYQDKYENEDVTLSQEDVNDIVSIIAESEMILQVFEGANTTVGASETEKAWVMEALENSEYDEAVKNAIKNIFDIQ